MTIRIPDDLRQVVHGCNRFAVDLYRRLAKSDRQFFFSPYSIACALGMTLAGARGNTAREIQSTLHLNIPADRIHSAFAALQEQMKTIGLEFNLANRIWCQNSYPLESEGVAALKDYYGAELGLVDFSQTLKACDEINAWVAKNTKNRIKRFISDVPPLTRVILINAIYFAGYWEEEFLQFSTRDLPFWITSTESIDASMMHQTAEFPYRENSLAQVVQLPYRQDSVPLSSSDKETWAEFKQRTDNLKMNGNQFAMQILLPKDRFKLVELEKHLEDFLPSDDHPLENARVSLRLPKFHFEYSASLNESLQTLGIRDAFEFEEANFDHFSRDPEGFALADVVHQAIIRVDEKGSEAAAATGVLMAAGCAASNDHPIEFVADQPFVVQIIDRRTGLIHFMGRVSRPKPSRTEAPSV